MYYIIYNDFVVSHPYRTREEVLQELTTTFAGIQLDENDVAYWPSISARGNTKIEIKTYDGEID